MGWELGWVAGLLEGEGYLGLHSFVFKVGFNPGFTPRIIIFNTEVELLKFARKIIGGNLWHRDMRGTRCKDQFHLTLNGDKARAVRGPYDRTREKKFLQKTC